MSDLNDTGTAPAALPQSVGSVRLTPLESRLLNMLDHVRLEDTHGLAGKCGCRVASANNALYRLYRLGLIAIEERGKSRTGPPTVWSTKTNW